MTLIRTGAIGFSLCLSISIAAFAAQVTSEPAIMPGTVPAAPATEETHYSRSADGEIRFQEGLSRYTRGDLAGAEADFKALVSDDPGDSESY